MLPIAPISLAVFVGIIVLGIKKRLTWVSWQFQRHLCWGCLSRQMEGLCHRQS